MGKKIYYCYIRISSFVKNYTLENDLDGYISKKDIKKNEYA